MRIVIDTGVLWRPAALRRLANAAFDVVVPAVVFMERARQLVKVGRSPDELRDWIERNEFDIEPFGLEHAVRYGARILDDGAWRRVARDAMIAGHVGDDDALWTTNPKDFLALGVPRSQVLAIE